MEPMCGPPWSVDKTAPMTHRCSIRAAQPVLFAVGFEPLAVMIFSRFLTSLALDERLASFALRVQPRLRGHPEKHESAVGVDHGKRRQGEAAKVFG